MASTNDNILRDLETVLVMAGLGEDGVPDTRCALLQMLGLAYRLGERAGIAHLRERLNETRTEAEAISLTTSSEVPNAD